MFLINKLKNKKQQLILNQFSEYLISHSPVSENYQGFMEEEDIKKFLQSLGMVEKIRHSETYAYSETYEVNTKLDTYTVDHNGIYICAGSSWIYDEEEPNARVHIKISRGGKKVFESEYYEQMGYVYATHGVMSELYNGLKQTRPYFDNSLETLKEKLSRAEKEKALMDMKLIKREMKIKNREIIKKIRG